MERALSRAWAKTGKRMAARTAMIAITTSSSIRVKPFRRRTEPLAFGSSRRERRNASLQEVCDSVHAGAVISFAGLGAFVEQGNRENTRYRTPSVSERAGVEVRRLLGPNVVRTRVDPAG